MSQDRNSTSTNQPQNSGDWAGPEGQWNTNNKHTTPKLVCRGTERSNLKVSSIELADSVDTTGDKNNQDHQVGVCEDGIEGEEDKDEGIVGGEVGEVVGYSGLSFTQGCWLGDSLEVEKV